MGSPRKDVDWAAVERDYRPGVLSDREIGKRHGISHTSVRNKARADGWTRDLNGRIQQKAKAKVAAAVRKLAKGATHVDLEDMQAPTSREEEAQIVEDNAAVQAAALLGMRQDISRTSALCQTMVCELEAISGKPIELEKLTESILNSSEWTVEERVMVAGEIAKLTSLPSRVGALSKLSIALTRLVALQRQALGITEERAAGGDDSFEAVLREVLAEADAAQAA